MISATQRRTLFAVAEALMPQIGQTTLSGILSQQFNWS